MCTCHDRRNSRNFFKLGAWRAARAAQPRACFCLFRSGAELRRPGCSKNYAIHWWLKHSYPVDGIVCQLINSYLLDSVLSERYPPCRQLGSVLQTIWSYKITTTRSTSKWEVCNLSPSTFALGLLVCGPIYVWAWVQFKLQALTAVKRRSMRNALVPGRRPRKFPRRNLTETIAEPVLRE